MRNELKTTEQDVRTRPSYGVRRAQRPPVIDADFQKALWRQTEPLEIACVQPTTGTHRPVTRVKMCYDEAFVYVMFRVEDRFVRAVATETHGPVWQDSCVEFFFCPQAEPSEAYFNLEVNCIGTFLMRYQTAPHRDIRFLENDDCEQIRLAVSLTRRPIVAEIDEAVVWTVQAALPIAMLRGYTDVEPPSAGGLWRGNFYKCAEACSHPHWLSWSPIETRLPDFHRPDCFGVLKFQ